MMHIIQQLGCSLSQLGSEYRGHGIWGIEVQETGKEVDFQWRLGGNPPEDR